MWLQFVAGLSLGTTLLVGADIRGTITIERKLTRYHVTAPGGMYQRGMAVELGSDAIDDPLAFERSHVAVYLEATGVHNAPAIASPEPMPQIEQHDRRFVPDFLVVPAGTAVAFPNFDPVFHNVFSLSKAKSFDLGNYKKGDSRTVILPTPGVVAVYCHLHPNMSASIVVAPSRFAVRVDRDGTFVLKDVLPGTYTAVAWHKTAGTFRKSVDVSAAGGELNFVLPYVVSRIDPPPANPPAGDHVAHR